uniref:Uncharacterized protein n=1 Tax=Clytia hemisphaerica TaxID=252671 RepID=A0A7M5UE89_9CNID
NVIQKTKASIVNYLSMRPRRNRAETNGTGNHSIYSEIRPKKSSKGKIDEFFVLPTNVTYEELTVKRNSKDLYDRKNQVSMLRQRRAIPDDIIRECQALASDHKEKFPKKSYEEIKEDAVKFFKKCIVDLFGFRMESNPEDQDRTNFIAFKDVPTFEEREMQNFNPMKDAFEPFAKVMEIFLIKAGGWERLLKDKFFKDHRGSFMICKNLLYVVGARYAYYTYLLWIVSKRKIGFCRKNKKTGQFYLPKSICIPGQIGSLTCTSDADVSLVGQESGDTVVAYNKYFENLECNLPETLPNEKCGSDRMMDNNVYAYSLELAAPEIFLPNNAADKEQVKMFNNRKAALEEIDQNYRAKWLDLLFAILQSFRQDAGGVFKFRFDVYLLELLDDQRLKKSFEEIAEGFKDKDTKKKQEAYNAIVLSIQEQLKKDSKEDSKEPTDTKKDSKEDTKEDIKKVIFDLRSSLLKAAESYHSFGAIRTIVVAGQMGKVQIMKRLSLNDYIASAIENFGYAREHMYEGGKRDESNKEYLYNGSKYLWRIFACLKAARDLLVRFSYIEELETSPTLYDKENSNNKEFNIKELRDLFAEFFFVFKKNKKKIPEQYFSL